MWTRCLEKEMPFRNVNCNAASRKRLAALTTGENFFHAYIFAGGRNVDKMRVAMEFAKAAHCLGEGLKPCGICSSCVKADHGNHEDILFLVRDGNSIGVKQIEDLQIRLRGKPFASKRIIAIADEAERMTPQSQNKLLKTLEEPSGGNIIILLTLNPELLLGTLQSRCIILRLEAETLAADSSFSALAERFFEKLSAGGAYYEFAGFFGAKTERDEADDFLDALEICFRDALVADAGDARRGFSRADILRFIDCAEEAKRGVAGGFNVKYTLKIMILKMLS
jgi:hypothetical protein